MSAESGPSKNEIERFAQGYGLTRLTEVHLERRACRNSVGICRDRQRSLPLLHPASTCCQRHRTDLAGTARNPQVD